MSFYKTLLATSSTPALSCFPAAVVVRFVVELHYSQRLRNDFCLGHEPALLAEHHVVVMHPWTGGGSAPPRYLRATGQALPDRMEFRSVPAMHRG